VAHPPPAPPPLAAPAVAVSGARIAPAAPVAVSGARDNTSDSSAAQTADSSLNAPDLSSGSLKLAHNLALAPGPVPHLIKENN